MVFKVGEGVGSFYRYKVLGIWQYSEKETAALFGCEPGDIKLDLPSVKKDGNGYYYMNPEGERVDITAENPYGVRADYDRQVIGRNTPDWTLGFKNNFRYKDFDLSVFLYARWGQMMNYGSVIGKYSPNPDYNIPTYLLTMTRRSKQIRMSCSMLSINPRIEVLMKDMIRCIMWMDHSLNLKT